MTDVFAGPGGPGDGAEAPAASRFPFPPTVPHRHPAPPAAAGRVPRSPPARRRSAPSPVGPSPPAPCRPRAARSRRPPARDAPAAGRGPCGPVRGPEHRGPRVDPRAGARAGRSPPGERTKKPPAPVRGRGQDRRRRDRAGVHALPFAARASAPFAVANSAHRVTASGFSSIHASR